MTLSGPIPTELKSWKAQRLPGDPEPADLILRFYEEVPNPDLWQSDFARGVYHGKATEVVDALASHLPGGLFDAIFAEMARRKTSVLKVSLEPRRVSRLHILGIYRRRLAWDGSTGSSYGPQDVGCCGPAVAQTTADLNEAGEFKLAFDSFGNWEDEKRRLVLWHKMRGEGINEQDVAETRWPDPPREI